MLGMIMYYHVRLDNVRYDAVLSCEVLDAVLGMML